MKYDKLIIYYFSGTGNAKNAARWIIKVAEENGLVSQLINIDRFEAIEDIEKVGNTLIGFCFPTHGFNIPPIMLKFLGKFPKRASTDVFVLNTRAGLKMGKLFLPGISGIVQILAAIILRLKGFRIIGMQALDLPSNWLFAHPGLRKSVVDSIYRRCNLIVNKFALKILSGKGSYKALRSLPIDVALFPIAILYYLIGRFFLAKTLIATDSCTKCGKCILQCPVRAITMVNDQPFWSYKCESCMRCINNCPERAIETTHAYSIAILIISSLVISPLLIGLLKYFGAWELVNRSIFTEKIWSLINAFFFIMFVFFSYRILHYLMRYKIVNKIITYTSLSKYKFWRRYKAPNSQAKS